LKYVIVFIGGGFGALSRFIIGGLVQNMYGGDFPVGTFAVNIIGSFLIGFLFSLEGFGFLSYESRLLLMVGFLGGFTTFSSFMLESVNLIPLPQFWLNVVGQVGVGLISVYAGIIVGRWIV